MKINKIVLLGLMLVLLVVGTACEMSPTVEQQETAAVENAMTEMNNQVGMPFIDDFFEKKTAKQIFELRDNAELITHAYLVNLDGQFVYLGACVGFGLPYSVQYTNPEKIERAYSQGGFAILPQADPNGLYMPEGLSATWLMLINEDSGETEIIYAEPEIIVTQSKLPKRLVASWSLTADY